MKIRPLYLVGGFIGLVLLATVAWYLASPLFINNQVDETFPFEAPKQAAIDSMSAEEKMAIEEEFMTAVPSQAEVAALSPENQALVETKVQQAAAVVMDDKVMEEVIPEAVAEWVVVRQGQFANADDFHQGSGNATIYQQGDQRVLRLENFTVTNGPDLHVLLSTSPNLTSSDTIGDTIDLGALKGNQGNQNYDIPAGIDLAQYHSIIIYCVPFRVLFSIATLS